MEFKQALEALKQGFDVKRPHWSGFWRFTDGSIKMHCKDGRILDIRESEDILYTLEGIIANDWEIANSENSKLISGEIILTFSFGEAIRNLKNGKRVARKGWIDKDQFLFIIETGIPTGWTLVSGVKDSSELPFFIAMNISDRKITPWLASQTDMLSEDWYLVK